MDLPTGVENTLKAGGITAIVLGALSLLKGVILKWLDKHKSPHEVLDEITETQRDTIEHKSKLLHDCEDDATKLRALLRDEQIKNYELNTTIDQLNSLIINYLIDYPHAEEWWGPRLARVAKARD